MKFDAELWRHDGDASWYFVTVPTDVTSAIDDQAPMPRKGFGSVRVEVTIGSSTWKTSVFPQSAEHYVLPVKKQVRTKEGVDHGDVVSVQLRVLFD